MLAQRKVVGGSYREVEFFIMQFYSDPCQQIAAPVFLMIGQARACKQVRLKIFFTFSKPCSDSDIGLKQKSFFCAQVFFCGTVGKCARQIKLPVKVTVDPFDIADRQPLVNLAELERMHAGKIIYTIMNA